MRKSSERLTAALVTAIIIGGPSIAHARFTRLFGKALEPKNNIGECLAPVRKHIARINTSKWGAIQFDCNRDGYVRSLYMSPESRAFAEIKQFVNAYWQIFDAKPVSLIDGGGPWPTLVFMRGGLPFHVGDIDTGRRSGPDGLEMAFVDLRPVEDALPTGFVFKPGISKDRADAEALRIAAKRGHPPYKIENTELVVRLSCLNNQPDLHNQPELVWWVRIRETGNRKPVACFIDASTGKACEWNEGCSSSSDAFEL